MTHHHPPVLAASRLTVHRGEHRALSDVSFELERGSMLAVIGPNGSGKSTLLATLVGLLTPTSGSVGCDRADTALVLQSTEVDRGLPITVRDTVRMARYARLGMLRRFGSHDLDAVARAMERMGVDDLAGRQLHALSGGQRQRVLVAQGLAQEADILLLDEPVTGLDVVSRKTILDVLAQEQAVGRTVVMTTHSLEDARLCDQVLLLAERAVAFGPPDETLVEHHLRDAYGGSIMRLAHGELLMDDPHHRHHHHMT